MLEQNLSLSLKNYISLKTQQSLKILSLNQVELFNEIKERLNDNPFLEDKKNISSFEDEVLKWQVKNRSSREHSQKSYEFFEHTLTANETISSTLIDQLKYLECDNRMKKILLAIFSDLDERGFTTHSHKEIFQFQNVTAKELRQVYTLLKQLEPLGVCAQSSWQALLWQAEVFYSHDELLNDILLTLEQSKNEIGELSDEVIAQLAEFLYVDQNDIRDKIKLLISLDPFPCRHFKDDNSDFIFPEIEIQQQENTIEVKIKDQFSHAITVNDGLYKQTMESIPHQQKEVWQQKYNEAKNLIASLEYRQTSLNLAIQYIIEHQKDFFISGPVALKPLNLNDIAEKLNVNISTVSRVLNHKYLYCTWGVFPVKFFFANRIQTTDGSGKTSQNLSDDIKAVIDGEDKSKPFSDLQILQILKEKGYDIHRRTVAKYRAQLDYKAASERVTREPRRELA